MSLDTFTTALYVDIRKFTEKYGKPPTHIVMNTSFHDNLRVAWQYEDRRYRIGHQLPETFAGLTVVVDDIIEYSEKEYKLYLVVTKGGSTYYYD